MKNPFEKCSVCPKRLYCVNKTSTPCGETDDCFVAPTCEKCPVNSHCKNNGLPGVEFGLTEGSYTPNCFSGFHSTK